MPQYQYEAVDARGHERRGRVVADDEGAAVRELQRQGLVVTAVRDAVAAGDGATARPRRITPADRLGLLQELATLLGAGVSLAEALPTLAESHAALATGPVLARLDRALRSGSSLSAALADSSLGLPAYALALAQAGEASGDLAGALRDAALQMDHERRIAEDLRSALLYPSLLVLAGVGAVGVIFVGVVPRFAGLLRSARAELPEISRWVIESGLFVQTHLGRIGLAAAVLALLAAAWWSRPQSRARLYDGLSRLPVVGPWLVRVEIGRWATLFGQLLANRVPIIDALRLADGALRLPRLRQDLAAAPQALQAGRPLSELLAALDWFPPARLNLVRVGERSGELPRMLATLGAIETEAARVLQKRALALIEPVAILVIGAVIGFIMVAVMLAITSLNTVAF